MSRFCKTVPDEARPYVHEDINGLPFPPKIFDFSKHATSVSTGPKDRLEYPERAFKDVVSVTTFVPEDEPIKTDNDLWKRICQEEHAENMTKPIDKKQKEEFSQETLEGKYVEENVLPVLKPALHAALIKMKRLNIGKRERSAFDPVDYVAEYLWNFNPRFPKRESNYKTFFEIPPFRQWLLNNPRPDWPRHWYWSQRDCAVCIQRNVRGWLVRKKPEVQQLRQFWKVLKGKEEPPVQDPELTFGQNIDSLKEKYAAFKDRPPRKK